MSIEAMKDALITLVFARGSIEEWGGYASEYFQNKHDLKGDIIKVDKAITSLRQAIEQAEKQEPVNWSVFNSGAEVASGLTFSEAWDYLTPERLAREWCAVCVVDQSNMPITPQPQRPWVELTPADFDWLEQVFANKVSNDFVFADIVCVISAKLKEKNT